jgi:hypothetical protein
MLLLRQRVGRTRSEALRYAYMHVKPRWLIQGCVATHAEWNGTEREEEEEET